jgi:hypothetical protein
LLCLACQVVHVGLLRGRYGYSMKPFIQYTFVYLSHRKPPKHWIFVSPRRSYSNRVLRRIQVRGDSPTEPKAVENWHTLKRLDPVVASHLEDL